MIRIVTLTGADGSIRPGELKALSASFPFVEWGILVSRKSMGGNRFPAIEWLDELSIIKKDSPDMKLSCHLCGAYVREVLMGDASFINEIGPEVFDIFDRVQINTHGREHDFNAEKMVAFMNSCDKEFIFQYDNANEHILNAAAKGGVKRYSTLFDMSHGAGVLPWRWPMPIPNVQCGYAGGLSPQNLKAQIELIEDKVGELEIWIDAETHVRSENDQLFDLNKCREFLQIAEEHMKSTIPARGVVTLNEAQQAFATHVGYEVLLKDGGTGINMGLYFPESWAEDGILKANGVNVFFPKQNKIYVQNFNQVELVIPKDEPIQMNSSEVLFGFMGWLTSREEVMTLSSRHLASPAAEAISKFMDVNKLPPVRDGWEKVLVHPEANPHGNDKCEFPPNTKHTSQCLRKAADDEPIFVLRSKDPTAPRIVRAWASVNEEIQPEAKVKGARDLAGEMEAWFRENCI